MRQGYVYKIVNKINGKIYIGETINSIQKRFSDHKNCAFRKTNRRYNCAISRAIRKYGVENFEIFIIETISGFSNEVKCKIQKIEAFYIKLYESNIYGYNLDSGGGRGLKIPNKETRNKQSIAKLKDPRTKKNLDHARSFQHPEIEVSSYDFETGEKIKTFPSIKEAADFYNIDRSAISKCCRDFKKSLSSKYYPDIKMGWGTKENPYTPIYTIQRVDENGNILEYFTSMSIAAKKYNIPKECIGRCCMGKNKYTGKINKDKLYWKYNI